MQFALLTAHSVQSSQLSLVFPEWHPKRKKIQYSNGTIPVDATSALLTDLGIACCGGAGIILEWKSEKRAETYAGAAGGCLMCSQLSGDLAGLMHRDSNPLR